MRELAAHYEHESAFVLPGRDGCDLSLRFFVPNHEMEMCGHATLGTVWLLKHLGLHPEPELTIATLSGGGYRAYDGRRTRYQSARWTLQACR